VSELTFRALRALADGRFHSGEEMARSLGRSRATLSEALRIAPDLGIDLFSVRGKGYRLAEPIEFLDASAIGARLAEGRSRIRLQVVDQVESTSTRLLELAAAGAPSGTCLAAEWQSAGRGRRGRSWVATVGGSLVFSLLWRFERGAGHLGGLSLAAGVAVARAMSECGVERAQVKWPNDVVADLRKLAGILVETSGEIQGPTVVVVGVGVNYRLADRAKDLIDQPVADVVHCAPAPPSRSALLAAVLLHLGRALEDFDRRGFAGVRDDWRAMHAYQGRDVRVVPPRDAPFDAKVVDVAPDGALVVATPDGRTLALSSAEISLRGKPVSE
jgi:BirA family biotin operon repressor/biotin-[acetyl-CoA-carboxylase] ligase